MYKIHRFLWLFRISGTTVKDQAKFLHIVFQTWRTRLTTLTKLCLPHHCSMFPPDISIRPTTPWSEIAKRDLISLCSLELLQNYDTVNTFYNYKDAVNTMCLLILMTASSFASNSVSPTDLDARITCCRTSSILRIALINSGKLILANRLMIRQKILDNAHVLNFGHKNKASCCLCTQSSLNLGLLEC